MLRTGQLVLGGGPSQAYCWEPSHGCPCLALNPPKVLTPASVPCLLHGVCIQAEHPKMREQQRSKAVDGGALTTPAREDANTRQALLTSLPLALASWFSQGGACLF